MPELDASFTRYALAADSPFAYVLPYVPQQKRNAYRAVLALDEQIARVTGSSSDREPRYAKLAWWQEEFRRLAAGNPRHPVTCALGAIGNDAEKRLTDLLQAAIRELDHIRFEDIDEMLGHALRRQGSVQVLLARALSDTNATGNTGIVAGTLGQAWWLTHSMTGTGPADVSIVADRGEVAERARALYDDATGTMDALAPPLRRVFAVQAALGRLLLETVLRQDNEEIRMTHVPPLRATWRAWRTARSTR